MTITGQMILRIWFQLTKMQQCFQAGGDDHHYNENNDDDDDEVDVDDDDTRCNDSTRMTMVCEMPEWNSNDLWIEATPPIPPQETSLVWEKQARNFDGWFSETPAFFRLIGVLSN